MANNGSQPHGNGTPPRVVIEKGGVSPSQKVPAPRPPQPTNNNGGIGGKS